MPDYAASRVTLARKEPALMRHNLGVCSGPHDGLFGRGAGSRWPNDPVIPIIALHPGRAFRLSFSLRQAYITLVLNNGYKPTTIRGQLRLIARLNPDSEVEPRN